MKNFIEVYDNLIHPQLSNDIEYLLISGKISDVKYTYSPNLTSKESSQSYIPGLCHDFHTPENSPVYFALSQILYNFCHSQFIYINSIFQARAFLQLPVSSNNLLTGIHKDLEIPHWVCLYYVNDSDGDTIFFNNEKKEIKRVSPKKGRVAFFDGNIFHSSSSPTKNTRAVLNFDFVGRKLG